MKKILIIDDEAEIRSIFQEILEEEGYFVTTGSNAVEGLACLNANSFDLIIMDKKLPGLTGPEFIKQAGSKTGSAKVLLISGSPSDQPVEGIHGFLPKPCEMNELIAVVKKMLD